MLTSRLAKFNSMRARGGARRSAARRTQVSNAVRSCQISAGACRGVTSAQPCRSSAWIIIRLSLKPKSSTVNPSRVDQASVA